MRKANGLLAQYRTMHEAGHFQGMGCLHFYADLQHFVTEIGAKSLLDYGCGKARYMTLSPAVLHAKLGVYIETWMEGIGVTTWAGYDPCWPPYAGRPDQQFDLVSCTSVGEHVRVEDVPALLTDVFDFATRGVFFAVGTTPAKKVLPHGQNAHVTVQPLAWWRRQLEAVAHRYPTIAWRLVEEQEKEEDTLNILPLEEERWTAQDIANDTTNT